MSATTRLADPSAPAPVDARPRLVVPRWLAAAGWAVLLGTLAVLLVTYWDGPPYSPDSWAYYEQSRHVGRDFLRINSWHSYQTTEPYVMGNGPLWPVLFGLTAAVTRLGPHAGLVAAVGCVLGTAATLSALGRRIGVRGLGPVVTVGLLGFTPYLDEVLAARTFPLAGLLLGLLLLALLAAARRPAPAWPLAGAAAGGLVLTRPGALVVMPLLAALLILTRRRDWRWLLLAGGVFALVLTPWAIYGLAHFGTPFPADNRIVAAAVPQLYVSDVVDVDQVPTYADDPLGWLARVVGNVPLMALSVVKAGILSPTVVATAGIGLLLLRRWLPVRRAPRWLLLLLVTGAVLVAEVSIAELSTGYVDRRYLSLVVLLVVLTAVVLLRRTPVPAWLAGPRAGAAAGAALLVLPAGWALGYQLATVPADPDSLGGGAVERELRRCHGDHTMAMRSGTVMARHTALTGRWTANLPGNFDELSVARRRQWIATYDIGQLYLPPVPPGSAADVVRRSTEPLTLLAAAARVTPDPCATVGRLYRVSL
ncbi:hypothetical protein O7602_18630 [Micromonospora sp. WMMD1128]|uniref:hypothetical protein n=1 Tax=Micromonospora sp. WMMD1128 TaxID=3015150 RepID=UPI00248C6124|nr:hypothetical protein [Micromonospora sp. WMMD1128]WBB71751.1 hypothetical protein O7602_18630 [Micromonospora sp. WMMD1128]